jgi:hypothetical protein
LVFAGEEEKGEEKRSAEPYCKKKYYYKCNADENDDEGEGEGEREREDLAKRSAESYYKKKYYYKREAEADADATKGNITTNVMLAHTTKKNITTRNKWILVQKISLIKKLSILL